MGVAVEKKPRGHCGPWLPGPHWRPNAHQVKRALRWARSHDAALERPPGHIAAAIAFLARAQQSKASR